MPRPAKPKNQANELVWSPLYVQSPLVPISGDLKRGPHEDPKSIPIASPRYNYVQMWRDTWREWLNAQRQDQSRISR